MRILGKPLEFEWDKGNKGKSLAKHQVTNEECEEGFFDNRKKILKDILHSGKEDRYILLGRTKKKRLLFVVFTAGKKKLRVISARDLNKKERRLYYEEKTKNPKI